LKRSKQIWITYCSKTGGHRISAQALADFFQRNYPAIEVKVLNLLDYLPKPVLLFDIIGRHGNHILSGIWKSSYMSLAKNTGNYGFMMKRVIQIFLGSKLLRNRLITEYRVQQPKIIISCHDITNCLFAFLKHNGILASKLISVVTPDYNTHRLWIHQEIDKYFVATDEVKNQIVSCGIPKNTIFVSGVPLRNSFKKTMHSDKKRKYYKSDTATSLPVITIMGGYLGEIAFPEIIKSIIDNVTVPSEYFVVFGKNTKVKKKIVGTNRKNYLRFNFYGLIDNPAEILSASDILISKSGGLTISEALGLGIPMLIVNPKSGQEFLNAQFISNCGAGKFIPNISKIGNEIDLLLKNRGILKEMTIKAKSLGTKNFYADAFITKEIINFLEATNQ